MLAQINLVEFYFGRHYVLHPFKIDVSSLADISLLIILAPVNITGYANHWLC